MRVPTSLVALMASAFVQHSCAQATDYGTPDGDDGQSPNGNPGSNPGGSPNGSPDGGLNSNAYGNPSGISNGSPTGTLGGISGSSPDASTCVMQGTTTVFVTVYPTSPLGFTSFPQPDNSDSGQTVYQTISPTTVLISPLASNQAAQSTVKPFTTLTIDVWGNDPNSGDGSGDNSGPLVSDSPSAPVYTDAAPTPVDASAGFPDGYTASTQAPWSNPLPTVNSGAQNGQASSNQGPATGSGATVAPGNSPYGDASGLPGTLGSPAQASAGYSSPYAVVTDTDVHWVPGSAGPTQITILSPHTITFGSTPLVSPRPDGSVPRLTVTGADGKPTVVEVPSGQPDNGNGVPQATSTAAIHLPPSVTNPVSGTAVSAGAGLTTCTSFTVVGPNGLPTVVHSTWVIAATATTAGPSGIPSGLPSGLRSISGAGQGSPNGPGVTTCTSYTVLGPDGRPTVVESTWMLPGPINTQSAIVGASSNVPYPTLSGFPSQITSGPSHLPSLELGSAGITTCTSYTVLGPDGFPTVVDSTWVVPNPTINAITGVPNQVSGFPGYPTQGSATAADMGGVTICTSYTFLGPNGLPTVVDTTWVIPNPTATDAAAASVVTGVPNQVSGFPSYPTQGSATAPDMGGVTTCTSYTFLGPNGLPTVVDTTWVIPNPTATDAAAASVVTGVPNQISGFPGYPSQVSATATGVGGVTTCTSYTVLGANGLPTVVESTFVVPASNAFPTATNIGFPSVAPQGTGLSQVVPPFIPGGSAITTCITVGIVGLDGIATPVVETVVLTPDTSHNALPVQTSIGFPSIVPEQALTGLPQGLPTFTPGSGAITTSITVGVVGSDGLTTPVVQTIVLTPSIPGLGLPTASLLTGVQPLPSSIPVLSGGVLNTFDIPSLNGYGTLATGSQTILPPSAAVSGIMGESGMLTGTRTSILTIIAGPSVSPAQYSDPWGNGAPVSGSAQLPQNGYGSVPTDAAGWASSALYGPPSSVIALGSPHIITALQTSTWTNIIPEQTTTYTMNFPLTTLATVTIPSPFSPNKRAVRRQQSSLTSGTAWTNSSSTSSTTLSENTSLAASLSSALGGEETLSPTLPPFTTSERPQASSTVVGLGIPSMCATGGKIGNSTLDFDDTKPGPLFNPLGDIWFSEGFLIAPPSTQRPQPYIPSSGGQLVEFVPPSLSSIAPTSGTGDTAEIGVGPNAASPCFRFDFQGASLGCAAEGNEQWCEFEISAYTYNEGLTKEESIAWSETKRVPACPNLPHGNCQLTPVQFDGYTNLTSVLINLHVGLELRVWWGDDIKVGWTDNSCAAAACRANAAPQRVKRETIESVARRGVWHWTPSGLKRLDDDYIWELVQ